MGGRLGLVLSGGGTRGIAHVGVLRALGDRGIDVDVVAGSSSGAIVGALYAAGYSPPEMLRFFVDKQPFHLSKLSLGKPGFLDTSKIVDDFEEYFPEDSFEALHIPLRVVATDILSGQRVVFDSGPLIQAILASCSVPVVFTPTEIGGRSYSDGGIVSNFPVELIEDRCEVVLGVYTSSLLPLKPKDLNTSLAVLRRALEIGMYQASQVKFERCDVLIRPEALHRFGSFDTKGYDAIEAVGYDAAMDQMPAIEQAVSRA